MTIKFKGKPKSVEVFICEMCELSGLERGRCADGRYSPFCVGCLQKFREAIAAWKSKQTPLWFLGRKP